MMADDKFYRARVTKREEFAPDLWMIRIQSGGEFKFAPGQYARYQRSLNDIAALTGVVFDPVLVAADTKPPAA